MSNFYRCFAAALLGLAPISAGAETVHVRLVNREAVEARLREYSGTNSERGARLKRMFVDAGCGEHLSEQRVTRSTLPNVVCVLPGASDRVIIVGAHFDRVPDSDGVADNWSGASLLPSLYESVKVVARQHTYVFVGFTDEEKGLIGSRSYASQMNREQVAATDAMVNLDTLGLAPTEVWSHRSDMRLMQGLLGVADRLKLPLTAVNFEMAGYSTDSESFAARKIPRITVHSLTQQSENDQVLHTSKDKLSAMNLDYYYDTYHVVAVYLGFLDQNVRESENPPAKPVAGEPRMLELPGAATLEMAWIPAGSFTMGSPPSEPLRRADEAPLTRVTLSKGFWLGKTHVTIGQWQAVMGRDVRGQLLQVIDDDALYDLGGKRQTKRAYMNFTRENAAQYLANEAADLPMYFVSWDDAMEFCRRLNALERAAHRLPAGYEYNLPTEAQWEYAARAGTSGATYAAPLDDIAWYTGNSAEGYQGKGFKVASGSTGGPRAVAGRRPNHWGLHDMLGNVWQWCRDWYGPYPGGEVTDPIGPVSGTGRVNRGGSFGSSAGDERSASRASNPPAEASAYRGFRVALVFQR